MDSFQIHPDKNCPLRSVIYLTLLLGTLCLKQFKICCVSKIGDSACIIITFWWWMLYFCAQVTRSSFQVPTSNNIFMFYCMIKKIRMLWSPRPALHSNSTNKVNWRHHNYSHLDRPVVAPKSRMKGEWGNDVCPYYNTRIELQNPTCLL